MLCWTLGAALGTSWGPNRPDACPQGATRRAGAFTKQQDRGLVAQDWEGPSILWESEPQHQVTMAKMTRFWFTERRRSEARVRVWKLA